jgi:ribonucleotide monophosphatase NagD (HAD superfamily)
MIGEDGIRFALEQKGFEVLPIERAVEAQAFVMGIDRGITKERLRRLFSFVKVSLYATNSDRTFPLGEIPGAGAWPR